MHTKRKRKTETGKEQVVYIMDCLNYFNHEAVFIKLVLNQAEGDGIRNLSIQH